MWESFVHFGLRLRGSSRTSLFVIWMAFYSTLFALKHYHHFIGRDFHELVDASSCVGVQMFP